MIIFQKTWTLWLLNTLLGPLMAVQGQSALQMAQDSPQRQASFQTPPCMVNGSVAHGVSGAPVKRAQVVVDDGQGDRGTRTQTDVEGAFVLSGMAAGKHHIVVHRKAYVDSGADIFCEQQNDTSASVPSHTRPVVIRIFPLGVISGEVMDDAGVPIANAVVRAYSFRSGRIAVNVTAITNDLGMYRLYGLKPGDYYISAEPDPSAADLQYFSGESPSDYLTTFFPQTTDVNAATRLTVSAGLTATGINIQLRKPERKRSANFVPISATSTSASLPSSETETASAGITHAGNDGLPAAAPQRVIDRSAAAGVVVNEITHEPIRHAKVTLAPTDGKSVASYSTQTDTAGQFLVGGLAPGMYVAIVERAGFLHTAHVSGGPRQLPASLAIKRAQELRNIVLEVAPASVITGKVLDADGDPAPDVHVQAMESRYVRGKPQFQIVAMSKTDDLGEYRLYGLSRGQYYVSATTDVVEGNEPERYATTFFPSAVDAAAASLITVDEASQIGGIDIASVVPTLVDIRGTVSCASAPLGRDTVVALKAQGAGADLESTSTTGIDAEGHFHFRGVAPAAYRLSAFFMDEHQRRYLGTETLEVRNAEIDNLELPLNRAVAMSGRIDIEGVRQNLQFTSLRVLLEPESDFLAGSLIGEVKPDGSFLLDGVLPSEYTLSIVGLPSEYYLKKVQVGMQDVAGRKVDFKQNTGSLDIRISSLGGTISGTIFDGQQQPAIGVNVALVPDPPRPDAPDLYKDLRTNAQGQFTIFGVAPGDYQVFAIQGAEASRYLDSDWVTSLRDYAQEVSIEENATVTLTINEDAQQK